MKKLNVNSISLQLLVFIFALCSGFSAWSGNYRHNKIIVKLKKGVTQNKTSGFLGKATTQKQMHLSRSWSKIKMYHFSLHKSQTVEQAIADLRNDPDVEYAEPDYILSKASTDEAVEVLSHDEMMALSSNEKVYTSEIGQSFDSVHQSVSAQSGGDVIVAVIDTGLDMDHPIFTQSGAIWRNNGEVAGNGIDDDGNGYIDDVNGWNFVDGNGTIYDDDDHGTHVSGIILSAAVDVFESPVDASPIKIMPLKFLDANGIGATSDAINAIYYAVDNGAHVLNNSWGGNSYSQALHEAVAYTYDNGKTFVAAAGNASANNDNAPMYPANYDVPHVQSIAATTSSDNLASFSNFGYSTVDIGSPGVFIRSSIDGGGYGYMSGTSMAVPYVAGVSAMMIHFAPAMLGHQVKSIVETTTDYVAPLSGLVSKEGRLNPVNSIDQAKVANVSGSQPAYDVAGASRELASADAGGCGLVSKMHTKFNHNNKNGGGLRGGNSLGYVLTIIFVLSIPFALTLYIRSRDPANRRTHERFHLNSSVTMNVNGKELKGQMSSISLGGAKIDTAALLKNGGIIKMQVVGPDGKEMIEVEGKVVWADDGKSYGVKFAEATSATLNQISNWTESLEKC